MEERRFYLQNKDGHQVFRRYQGVYLFAASAAEIRRVGKWQIGSQDTYIDIYYVYIGACDFL